MAKNLIGTAADQVSVNGMLGELAFQSKDNVNFTGGTGKLSKLDIDAISAQLGVTATKVFVYDTSKDSDGGAWRKRTQNTSWYNETLNTSTRGSRREFPSVAVITIATNSVTIYDADDSTMPMWMVFNGGNTNNFWAGGGSYGCGFALNGIMYVGGASGVRAAHFVRDGMSVGYTPASGAYTQPGGVANRNDVYTSWIQNDRYYAQIASATVYDISMAVVQGAPIDDNTKLPVPTVAIATTGGVTVINNNFTTVNVTASAGSSYLQTPFASVFSDGYLIFAQDTFANGSERCLYLIPIPSTSRTVDTSSGSIIDKSIIYGGETSSAYPKTTSFISNAVRNMKDKEQYAWDRNNSTSGVSIFVEQTDITNTMVRYVTSKYSTGWMQGNIKGAWLTDTTQETITRTELVTNGTFAADTSWTKGTGWTISGGIASHAGAQGYLEQTIPGVVAGKTYIFTVTVTGGNVVLAGGQFVASNLILAAGTNSYVITAVNNALAIYSNSSATVDNVSIILADADRSVNAVPLQLYGTLTKTPVATGADLVAYSGWSGSNYLQQPYNAALNFGTGDFFITAWSKTGLASAYNEICDIAQAGTNSGRLEFLVNSSGGLTIVVSGTTISTSAGIVAANTWNQLCAVRRSGVVYLYVNGVMYTSIANTASINNTSAMLYVGINYAGGNSTATDQLALLRISATAPSDAQILKMYNDEKQLFQDNAKATLYGTSDSITSAAFDEDTRLLHVGTSSGRSVFQGLRRIDNTTTAVTASISAANSLVAEQ